MPTTDRRDWTPEQFVQECLDIGLPVRFQGTLISMVAEAQHEAQQALRRDLATQYHQMAGEVEDKLTHVKEGRSPEWQDGFNTGIAATMCGLRIQLEKRIREREEEFHSPLLEEDEV